MVKLKQLDRNCHRSRTGVTINYHTLSCINSSPWEHWDNLTGIVIEVVLIVFQVTYERCSGGSRGFEKVQEESSAV